MRFTLSILTLTWSFIMLLPKVMIYGALYVIEENKQLHRKHHLLNEMDRLFSLAKYVATLKKPKSLFQFQTGREKRTTHSKK